MDVVRERIGRAHRENGQRGGSVSEDLSDVVDGAVAATGKDGVAAGVDGAASFLDGVMGRFRRNEIGLYGPVAEHREGGLQFSVALLTAAGVRVVKQRGLTHSEPNLDCT